MNPKSTLNNNAITLNDLFYEWKDLLYYIYTHTMSLAFLKNKRGKYIYVYFILVTTD